MTDDITALVKESDGYRGSPTITAALIARMADALTAAQARMADSEQQCALELGAMKARLAEVEKERDAARAQHRAWRHRALEGEAERDAARASPCPDALPCERLTRMAAIHSQVIQERDAARERIEDLGEMAGVCVGRYLGRRCSYCQCDGKNLTEGE